MRETVICEPVRTPIGRYGGSLKALTAVDLGVIALRGLIDRSGVSPEAIEDVILGHCNATGEAPAIGRVVALDAGLAVTTPGLHLDRRCGSGLQAVINAVMQVQSGASEMVVAGGTESMSNAPFYSLDLRWGRDGGSATLHDGLVRARVMAGGKNHLVAGGMLETAENLRRQYSIPREEQDQLALESHRRAVSAQREGIFAEEIVPVEISIDGRTTAIDTDEHPRPDTDMDALRRLKPILRASDPEATVTAGNSSGQNDGAALCIVTTRERADRDGLRHQVSLKSWAVAGVGPEVMGIGPVPATEGALARADLSLSKIDCIELNEAFAAQTLAVTREWRFGESDFGRMNVHGSGISLGHPVGATGSRMLGTLARELHRRGATYGLVTMCIGGGQGLAAVFERVS